MSLTETDVVNIINKTVPGLVAPPIAIPFNGDKTKFLNGANQLSTPSGSAGASWVPLVDGSEPPNFITDGAGNLIFVAFGP